MAAWPVTMEKAANETETAKINDSFGRCRDGRCAFCACHLGSLVKGARNRSL
jgi:hypothetical protein